MQELKNDSKVCSICEKNFIDGDEKVIDHDHLTGEFRGVAHNDCNLQFNLKDCKIPVIFHNLKGYDSHLILY
jgi:hypothetical protein